VDEHVLAVDAGGVKERQPRVPYPPAVRARWLPQLVDFTLNWSGGEAAFWALDEKAQQTDRAAWTRAYLAADEDEYPHIFRIRDELPKVGDDAIFETILSLVITGLMQRAPRPCACGTHRSATSGQ
jgi:hypothetical protein